MRQSDDGAVDDKHGVSSASVLVEKEREKEGEKAKEKEKERGKDTETLSRGRWLRQLCCLGCQCRWGCGCSS